VDASYQVIVSTARRAAILVAVVGLLASACASSSSPVAVTSALGYFPAVLTGSFSLAG
jgi:hypothetical protein